MTKRTEFAVTTQTGCSANVEGTFYDTYQDALEAFEAEVEHCRMDARFSHVVRLYKCSCTYDGDECIDVKDLEQVKFAYC